MKRPSLTCWLPILLPVLLPACTENKAYETAVCTLADVSGTYAEEKSRVADIIKAGVLPAMDPGDSLFFITIDSNSFNEENLKYKTTLDYRPSRANKQKLGFADALDTFASDSTRSGYTDISGAMMLCSDYLKSTGAGTQLMFIFSDMAEDLEPGVTRRFQDDELAGVHIAAMNVIKLARDSSDPAVYRQRLQAWQDRLTAAGAADWQVIFEAAHIPEFIDHSR